MTILNPKYDFLKADYSNPNLTGKENSPDPVEFKTKLALPKLITAVIPATLLLVIPSIALASDVSGTFDNVYKAVMTAFDAGVVLVIVFAGAAWALGHRSKGIELLIGVCCGYLVARNAVNIRDFLKSI